MTDPAPIVAELIAMHDKPLDVQIGMLVSAIGSCQRRIRIEAVATDRYPPGGAPTGVLMILRMRFDEGKP